MPRPCRHRESCPRLATGTCQYAHTPEQRLFSLRRARLVPCQYGYACRHREDCLYDHQSTRRRCRNRDCEDSRCTFSHRDRLPCPGGWECTETGCTLTHPPPSEVVHQLIEQLPAPHRGWVLYTWTPEALAEYQEMLMLQEMAECPGVVEDEPGSDDEYNRELELFEASLDCPAE